MDVLTTHVCHCGHRCSGKSPLGVRLVCVHVCRMAKAA